MDKEKIKSLIQIFLDDECGLKANEIEDDSPLFSTNLLDSLDLLDLVTFIEKEFSFEINAIEVGIEGLDTLDRIADFVLSKTGKG